MDCWKNKRNHSCYSEGWAMALQAFAQGGYSVVMYDKVSNC
jgi:hypothetical protein